MDPKAQVVQLKTQLVSEGHTRLMLAETDLMTLRIHCYAPGIGENALHAHTKEDHIFVVQHLPRPAAYQVEYSDFLLVIVFEFLNCL